MKATRVQNIPKLELKPGEFIRPVSYPKDPDLSWGSNMKGTYWVRKKHLWTVGAPLPEVLAGVDDEVWVEVFLQLPKRKGSR